MKKATTAKGKVKFTMKPVVKLNKPIYVEMAEFSYFVSGGKKK